MKKVGLALTLLSLAFSFSIAQKETPKKVPIKVVGVTARTVAGRPAGKAYPLDLTRKGTIYNLAADVDYSRVQVRTAKGEIWTMADLLKKTGRAVSGKLRIGLTSDIRAQKLSLARISGGTTLNYNCEGILCSCTGDEDCNDMFTKEACGDIAACDERGCWCFRI
jgi:hypothetical protein